MGRFDALLHRRPRRYIPGRSCRIGGQLARSGGDRHAMVGVRVTELHQLLADSLLPTFSPQVEVDSRGSGQTRAIPGSYIWAGNRFFTASSQGEDQDEHEGRQA